MVLGIVLNGHLVFFHGLNLQEKLVVLNGFKVPLMVVVKTLI